MSEKQIIPLQDRVLVEPVEVKDTDSKLNLIIPDGIDKEKPETGKVIAVGEGKMEDGVLIKPNVAVGDIVMFSKYGHDEIKLNGKEYFIMRSDAILAIIK